MNHLDQLFWEIELKGRSTFNLKLSNIYYLFHNSSYASLLIDAILFFSFENMSCDVQNEGHHQTGLLNELDDFIELTESLMSELRRIQ